MFSNKFRLFTVNNKTNYINVVNKQIFQNNSCKNLLNKFMSCGFKDMRKLRKGTRFSLVYIKFKTTCILFPKDK